MPIGLAAPTASCTGFLSLSSPSELNDDHALLVLRDGTEDLVHELPRALFETVQMDDDAIVEFVFDENLHRRHLSSSQRAGVAVNFLELEEQFAAQRREAGQRKGGQTSGRGRKKDSSVQTFVQSKQHAGLAAERAAKKVGTNRTSVHDAAKLKADDPEAFQAISKAKEDQPEHGNGVLGRLQFGVGPEFVSGSPEALFQFGVVGWHVARLPVVNSLVQLFAQA